jgi:hypothetical protein
MYEFSTVIKTTWHAIDRSVCCLQVKDAEQQIQSVLGSVKGRGTSGLDQQQQLELTAAIELLEKDGGVTGEDTTCCWLRMRSNIGGFKASGGGPCLAAAAAAAAAAAGADSSNSAS